MIIITIDIIIIIIIITLLNTYLYVFGRQTVN